MHTSKGAKSQQVFPTSQVTAGGAHSPYFSMRYWTPFVVVLVAAGAVAAEPPVVRLWPNGAPGSEGKTGIPERGSACGPAHLVGGRARVRHPAAPHPDLGMAEAGPGMDGQPWVFEQEQPAMSTLYAIE
jgi:hypothetical protein